jgi:pyrroline-5-carboxylate reductase
MIGISGVGSILLAGAGRMGGAMLDAWLDGGIAPQLLTVVDPSPDPVLINRLAQAGVAFNKPAQDGAPVDVMVLAIKPQMLASAGPGLAAHVGPTTVVISVIAGKTIADLRQAIPEAGAIARAMPNTPAAIRRGITGVAADPRVGPAQKAVIETLLQAIGRVEWLEDESLIDAVTAVSGSGPAYAFFLTECLAKAGEAVGLDPATAMRLARATIEGAGALMAARPHVAPVELRRAVTSPGGTTAAALDVLMRDDGLSHLMTEAVLAARQRAGELAG